MKHLVITSILLGTLVGGCTYLKATPLTQEERSRTFAASSRAVHDAVVEHFTMLEYTIEDSDYDTGVIRFDTKRSPAQYLRSEWRETISAFVRDAGNESTSVTLNIQKEFKSGDEWRDGTDSRESVVRAMYNEHLDGIESRL